MERCKELGAKEAFYIPLDMGREEDAKTLIDEAKKRLGGLDHLILNHVIYYQPKFWDGEFDSVMKKVYCFRSIWDEHRTFYWIVVWTQDVWFDVPAFVPAELSSPMLVVPANFLFQVYVEREE